MHPQLRVSVCHCFHLMQKRLATLKHFVGAIHGESSTIYTIPKCMMLVVRCAARVDPVTGPPSLVCVVVLFSLLLLLLFLLSSSLFSFTSSSSPSDRRLRGRQRWRRRRRRTNDEQGGRAPKGPQARPRRQNRVLGPGERTCFLLQLDLTSLQPVCCRAARPFLRNTRHASLWPLPPISWFLLGL